MWRSAWAKKTKYSVAHPQPAVQSQERVAKLCHPFSFWAHTSTPCRQERERERDVSSSSWCSTPPSSSPRGGGRPGAVLVGEACRLDGESDREGEATAEVDQWKGTAAVEVDMAPGARSAALFLSADDARRQIRWGQGRGCALGRSAAPEKEEEEEEWCAGERQAPPPLPLRPLGSTPSLAGSLWWGLGKTGKGRGEREREGEKWKVK